MTPSRKLLPALVLGASLLAGRPCLAAPASSNPGVPFQQLMDQHEQIQSTVDEIPGIIQIYGADEMDLLNLLTGNITVQAKVDVAACATALTQCGNGTSMAASNLNSKPVRLFVHVTRSDYGVANLEADAFVIHNPFYPGGGRAVRKCDTNCGDNWFQDGGDGLYSIFLEPIPTPSQDNWQAGEYAATINVTVHNFNGDRFGRTLLTFDIPSAVNVDK